MCGLWITNTDTLKKVLCQSDLRLCRRCWLPVGAIEMFQEVIGSTAANFDTKKIDFKYSSQLK